MMGHWLYCFEVKNAIVLSEGTQMNNVSSGIDEYLKRWRQSGDSQKRGHTLSVEQISASSFFFVVFEIKYS